MDIPKILLINGTSENLLDNPNIINGIDAQIVRIERKLNVVNYSLKNNYALIILDEYLSGMNSNESIEYLINSEGAQYTPIILMSSIPTKDFYKLPCVHKGSVDFIQKPVPGNIFLGKLKLFLQIYKTSIALQKSNKILCVSQKIAHVGNWEWDIAQNKYTLSEELCRIYGIKNSEKNRELKELNRKRVHPDDKKAFESLFLKTSATKSLGSITYRIILSSGEIRWLSANRPEIILYSKRGKPLIAVGTIQDITALKTSEEELKRTNLELMNFTYAASHDLHSPLNGISHISKWLEDDLQHAMTDETKKNMGLLRNRIKRMEVLLRDIMEFTTYRENENRTTLVDTKELIKEIIGYLDPPKKFSFDFYKNLPTFHTYRTPFWLIFRNLLQNTIKYHDKPKGRIKVTVKDRGSFYFFSVSDDGPGISSEFHSQIFNMFTRLKSYDEIEGSGIGLALVKKIVEKYNGKITLKSSKEKGSKFVFSWPKQMPVK